MWFSLIRWVQSFKDRLSGNRHSGKASRRKKKSSHAFGSKPNHRADPLRSRFLRHFVENLEERVVPSSTAPTDWLSPPRISAIGDPVKVAGALPDVTVPMSMATYGAFEQSHSAPSQIVFIDGAVQNAGQLINSIGSFDSLTVAATPAGALIASGPVLHVARSGATEVVVLDSRFDGVQQITEVLSHAHNLASIQVVSHGDPGQILLGDTLLTDRLLQDEKSEVSSWGDALQPDGDILLWGCDVSEGAAGTQFVNDLANTTKADVAASTNATGGTALGGDWTLETRTGPIEAQPVFTAAADSNYNGLLGLPDLPTYIQDLLDSQSASFSLSQTVGPVTLGNALQLGNVTLSGNITLTSGVWSGTIAISVDSASLFPGSTFSAAITPTTPGQPAISGSYTIGSGYALTAGKLTLNVGEALTVTATNVNLAYNPNTTGTQTLASNISATATSEQFTNVTPASLTNFSLRTDGFQFDSFNLSSAGSPSIGNFLTATSVGLTVSAFNATFGPSVTTPSLSGTVGVTVTGLQLFPAGSYVQLQSSAVTAAYNFSTFDGTSPTGGLSVTISGFHLALGDALDLSAGSTDIVLTPGQDVLATIPTVTLSSPKFTGLGTVTINSLQISRTGFTVGSLSWSTSSAVSVAGGILTFASSTPATTESATYSGSSITLLHAPVASTLVVQKTVNGTTTTISSSDYTLVADSQGVLRVLQFVSGHEPANGAVIASAYGYLVPSLAVNLSNFELDYAAPTTETVASWTSTSTIVLQHLVADPASVLVTSTPSGGSLTTLIKGVDYTLVPSGNSLQVQFVSGHAPATGSSVSTSYTYSSISGSVSFTAGNVSLFPSVTLLNLKLGTLTGQFDFGGTTPGLMKIHIGNLVIPLGDALTLNLGAIDLTPGLSTMLHATGVSITSNLLAGFQPFTLSSFDLTQTGFNLGTFNITTSNPITIGDFVSITGTSTIAVTNFAVDKTTNTVTGAITITLGTVTLFPGSTAVTSSFTGLTGTFDFSSTAPTLGRFTLHADVASLTLFSELTLTANDITITPALDTLVTIANATVTLAPLDGLAIAVHGVAIKKTGFTITDGSLSFANVTLGSIIALTTPTISVSNIAYTFKGALSGTIGFSANTAALHLGTAFDASVGVTSGAYDLTTKQLSLTIADFAASFAGFASIGITSAALSYTPATDGSAEILVGASGVTGFLGLPTSTGQAAVGLQLSGGTLGLAIEKSTTGVLTYAIDALGSVSLVGVPASTVSFTSSVIEFRKNTAGRVHEVINVDGTPADEFHLNFAQNEESAAGSGISLSVGSFITLSGDFGFTKFTDGTSSDIAIVANNVSATVSAGTVNLSVDGASLGLILKPGATAAATTYALVVNGGHDALTGVPGLTLTADGLKVRIKKGLDVTTIGSLPTTALSTPPLSTTTTEAVTLSNSTTSNSLAQLPTDLTTLVLTSTLSGVTTTLVQGTDYDLVPDSTTVHVHFTGHTPATGETFSAAYSYNTAQSVTLDFTGLGTGSGDVTDVEGHTTVGVAGFATLEGDFGFQKFTPTTGADVFAIGAKNVNAVLGTSDTNVTVSGATLGILAQGGKYALNATASSIALNGITDLTLSATSVAVKVLHGLDLTTISTPPVVHTSAGDVTLSFTGLGTTDVTSIQGHVTLTVNNFGSLVGDFGFQSYQDGATGAQQIAVGAKNLTVVLGTTATNLTVANASFGLVVRPGDGTTTNPTTYAMEAQGSPNPADTSLNGVSGITLNASGLLVRVRNGLDLTTSTGFPTAIQTSAGDITPDFSGLGAGTTNVTDVEGAVSLTVADFATIQGEFGFQRYVTGGVNYFAIGVHGGVSISAGPNTIGLTDVSVGALVKRDATGTVTYALQATTGTDPVAFNGPLGVTLTASNMMLKIKQGLDLTTYPSGVPTTISLPAPVRTATDPATVIGSTTTAIALVNANVDESTVVVTATPSGGSATTLVRDTDYTLSRDSLGVETITFASGHVPSVGTSVSVAYTYRPQGPQTIALDFTGLGSADLIDIEGHGSFSIAGFASIEGDFGFQKYGTGATATLVVGGKNINAVLGTSDTNVTVSGASFGLMSQGANYALITNGGALTLNGVPDLTVSATSLHVEVRSGMDAVSGAPTTIHTPGGNVSLDFSGLPTGTDGTSIAGHVTLGIANFVSVVGDFSFTKTSTTSGTPAVTLTKILVGASNVDAFIGASSDLGLQITGASLGLVILRDSSKSGSTYALQTSAPLISLVGLGDVHLSGNASVKINTTGAPVDEMNGTSTPVFFSTGTNIKSFDGGLTLTVGGFSVGGDFSFTKVVAGNVSKLLIGAANIHTSPGTPVTADSGGGIFDLSEGKLGIVFYKDTTTGTSLGYALSASAKASVAGSGIVASATLGIRRNSTQTGQNDVVTVGGASVPIFFDTTEHGDGTTAFQQVLVSNVSFDIDSTLLITAAGVGTGTPVSGAHSTNLTGVTLTLQEPGTTSPPAPPTVLFTISAGTAVRTTFTAPVATGGGGLASRDDGGSWGVGDIDVKLNNVAFSIGGSVSFTADSIDVQHYTTAGGATVNSFDFDGATISFLKDGSPLASLMGSPHFHFTTGDSVAANNGFHLDSFSNPGIGFLGQSAELPISVSPPVPPTPDNPKGAAPAQYATPRKLGPITLTDPGVTLDNFSFDFSGKIGATVTLSAAQASISVASNVDATFTVVKGSFDVSLQFDLSHLSDGPQSGGVSNFSITSNKVDIHLGTYLTLSATGLAIHPDAGATDDLISFTSLTATLNLGAVALSGSAANFAIEGDGSFLAKSNFQVSISLGGSNADESSLKWPSWLPLKSATITLAWADFNAHKDQFLIELSASVDTHIGTIALSGSVTNAVIDPQLVAQGKFPITSIDSFSVGASGNLFAGTLSGTLVAGIVRFDSAGKTVDGLGNYTGTSTPATGPITNVFYGGIQAAFSFGGMAGFNIRIGVSDFGPLQIYIEAGVPIPLGPTGLFLSNFRGGVTFGQAFPTITLSSPIQASDALQLRKPGFSTPDAVTADQWDAQLRAQVQTLYRSGAAAGDFGDLSNVPIRIQAGATLYAANPNAVRIDADMIFDTTGKFLIIGTATIGDSLSIGVKMFADLSQSTPTLLFLMEAPSQNVPNPITPPVYSVYGVATFSDINNVFKITVAGAVDYNLLNTLEARVEATISLTFTSNSFNITLSGGQFFIPQLQADSLAQAAGSLTIQTDSQGNINVWGAFLLTAPAPAFLTSLGVTIAGQIFAQVNSTSVVQNITLNAGNATYPIALKPQTFSLFVHGTADFAISGTRVFELNGDLAIEISPQHFNMFVQASLLLGNPNSPLMTFNANGLIYIGFMNSGSDHIGFATKLALTAGFNIPGVVFGANFLLVMNTTQNNITYTIPTPIPTKPATPPVKTVMGPDYSNPSNPNALVSYETVTNGVRTLVIPSGPPASGLSNYSNWSSSPATYLLILGRGTLNIANTITLTGNLNVLAAVSGGSVTFSLDVNAKFAVVVSGNTVFSFATVGGIQLSNAGIAAVLAINFASGFSLPSNLGFGLSAAFKLEVNTTNQQATFGSIVIPATQKVLIHGDGHLTLLGNVVDLYGSFDFSISSTSLAVAVNANVTLLGATLHADGSAAIYYDSHPGLALRIGLSLPGGAQGVAPISALGHNFVISGAFRLELNTTGIARQDLNGNTINSGFTVAIDNLGVYLYGFNLNGSISITLGNQGLDFDVSLTLDFFSLASISVSGYYHHDGSFSFTGTASFQFGDHFFGIGGSLSITVSNSGFGISVDGWAAAFGIEISAGGSILISGTSVDITIRFQVTLFPAVNIDTPDVDMYFFTIPGIHIHTAAVIVGKDATFHLGSISPPPTVADIIPPAPPPTPPHLAGVNSSGVLKLYLGDDVGLRVNDTGDPTPAQDAENYNLRLDPADTDPSNGQDIIVSALNFDQTYQNVKSILVSNTAAGNDTITIDSAILEPVNMTLGSGSNTINTGSGSATVLVNGGGGNTITSLDSANITLAAGASGSNQINTRNNSTVTINSTGNGTNQVAIGSGATVYVNGNENNQISDTGGTSSTGITINGTGRNTINVNNGTSTVTVASGATNGNTVTVNSSSASTINVNGGGINVISSVGSGSSAINVNGNGDNQITTGGPTTVTLSGSGNNQVSTGAGSANVYDYGSGGNTVTGGSGGGTFFYGLNSGGTPYSAKGVSSLTTAYGNFAVNAHGYSSYQLSDFGLTAGTRTLILHGVRTATLSAATSTANSFTLVSWSGNATLNGVGGNNTLFNSPGASVNGVSDVLSNSSLVVSGGLSQTITLNSIQTANLVGAVFGLNSFNVSAWTGSGALIGSLLNTTNTVIATDDSNFTLSDTLLQRTGGYNDLTLTRIQTANLTGGSSANTFNVSGWNGTANLFGVGAGDTYNLTLPGSGLGVFNVTDTGTSGIDTLNITGSATTQVTNSSVRVGTQRVNYGTSGIEVLNVNGGANGLTYNVLSTSSTVLTTVHTKGNTNTVNVSSTAGMLPATLGRVNGIQGALTVNGDTNTNTLNVDDRALTAGETGLVTATTISGLTMSATITYANMQFLNLNTGSGADTLTMTGIASGTLTTLNGGAPSTDSFIGTFASGFLGNLVVQAFESISMGVTGNFTGSLLASTPGNIQSLSITGSETSGSTITGDSITTGSVGSDVAGSITMSQSITTLTVGGSVTSTGLVKATASNIGTITVTTDVAGQVLAGGNIVSLSVGRDVSGTVQATGTLGTTLAAITGSVTSTGVVKGATIHNMTVGSSVVGLVQAITGAIDSLAVGGSVSGQVLAATNIGTLSVVHDVSGTVQATGTLGTTSAGIGGSVTSTGKVKGASIHNLTVGSNVAGLVQTITGSIDSMTVGGSVTSTGTVQAALDITSLVVTLDVAGQVLAGRDIVSLTIGRDVSGTVQATGIVGKTLASIGGSVTSTGIVKGATIHNLSVTQDVAGLVQALTASIDTMTVGGSVSGHVTAATNIGSLGVGHDVSGTVLATAGSITSMTVGGSVTSTGLVQAGLDITYMSVTVDVAGKIIAGRDIITLYVGGSISGKVNAGRNLNTLTVVHDVSGCVLVGGTLGQSNIGGSVTSTGVITAGAVGTLTVAVDFAGHVTTVTGGLGTFTVGHSITYQGVVNVAGNLTATTVGLVPSQLVVGDDMAGQIIVGGTLGDLVVDGGTPGTIIAKNVGTVRTFGGFGPFVGQIKEAGIQRNIESDVPGSDYPIPTATPTNVKPTPSTTSYVNYQYIYEGTANGLASPQLSTRITNFSGNTRPDQFDLVLETDGAAKFNLARVVAAGVTGVRNVVVEGDLLKTTSAAAATFIGQGATTTGGVMLPFDDVAGVSIRDLALIGTIQAKSIQAIAFGSTLRTPTYPVTGALVVANDAKNLLVAGTTPIVPGGTTNGTTTETFRVAFSDAPTQQVTFYLCTGIYSRLFDNTNIIFTVQSDNGVKENTARGAVTALIGVATGSYPYTTMVPNAIPQTIDLHGDGGSFSSSLWVAKSITSTGPLGDVNMNHVMGITNLTAPMVFGNVTSYGPISGLVQTTGLRTDPLTGVVTTIPADFGRAYVLTAANGTQSVTSTTLATQKGGTMVVPGVTGSAIMGQVIVRGNLYSKIYLTAANSGISGTIAVQGDIGASSTLLSTTSPTRVGGIATSSIVNGKIIALGNDYGDISLLGGMGAGGSFAVRGDILGNFATNAIAAGASIISGGAIGNAALGTGLTFTTNSGIIAANNTIIKKTTTGTTTTAGYYSSAASLAPGGVDAAAIRSIFADATGTAITRLDSTVLGDLGGVSSIAAKLARLKVAAGHLSVS